MKSAWIPAMEGTSDRPEFAVPALPPAPPVMALYPMIASLARMELFSVELR